MMTRPRTHYILPAVLLSVLAILIFCDVGNAQGVQSETGTVGGVVATVAPDGQSYNIPGASLKVKRGTQVAETSANDEGEYEFTKLAPGEYTLEATAEGFKTSSKNIAIGAGETLIENINLEVAEVTASVTVSSDAAQAVQTTETASTSTIKQKTLQTLPLPNEQVLDALPLVPGVVRGPDGQIDIKGARSSQSAMTVNYLSNLCLGPQCVSTTYLVFLESASRSGSCRHRAESINHALVPLGTALFLVQFGALRIADKISLTSQ